LDRVGFHRLKTIRGDRTIWKDCGI
jgi:hypothetical protein